MKSLVFKTCNLCRAQRGNTCDLGYRRKLKSINTLVEEYVPDQVCPKPKTYDDLLDELKSKERTDKIITQ
jgi:hypothetical protein